MFKMLLLQGLTWSMLSFQRTSLNSKYFTLIQDHIPRDFPFSLSPFTAPYAVYTLPYYKHCKYNVEQKHKELKIRLKKWLLISTRISNSKGKKITVEIKHYAMLKHNKKKILFRNCLKKKKSESSDDEIVFMAVLLSFTSCSTAGWSQCSVRYVYTLLFF